MPIERLEIRDFRNLVEVSLEPGPRINLIEGANASGKTSLLEAIHVAGVGRSFLTHQKQVFIRRGAQETTVFVLHRDNGHEQRTGVRLAANGDMEFRRNGEKVDSRAALARCLPMIVITPESHDLIEGGPKERRGFLDWGLFHVEQSFLDAWRRYQRALRQRNASLAAGAPDAAAWVPTLVETGAEVDMARRALTVTLAESLTQSPLLPVDPGDLRVDYEQGWSRERSLEDALARDLERDARDGYTHSGPHRAELRIRIGDRLAAEVLSRGQAKLMVCALWLAQIGHLRERAGKSAVVLLDDLPSELDERNRGLLIEALAGLNAQVFITTTDRVLTPASFSDTRLFHVEQGRFTTVI